MAAVAPFHVRVDQYLVEGRALRERNAALKSEMADHIKKGSLLIYENSPLLSRIDHLGEFSRRVVDLIVNIIKTVINATFSLIFLGLNAKANWHLKDTFRDAGKDLTEIGLLAYTVIFPLVGIDKLAEFNKTQRL